MANNIMHRVRISEDAGSLVAGAPVKAAINGILGVKQWNGPGGKLEAVTVIPTADMTGTGTSVVKLRLLMGNQRMLDNVLHAAYYNTVQLVATGDWSSGTGHFHLLSSTFVGGTTGDIAVTGDSLPTAAGVKAAIDAVLPKEWICRYGGDTVATDILADGPENMTFEFIQMTRLTPSVPDVFGAITTDVTTITGDTAAALNARKITEGAWNTSTYGDFSRYGTLLDTWTIPTVPRGTEVYHTLNDANGNPRRPVIVPGDWLIFYETTATSGASATSKSYLHVLADQ